jgi:hypothetical protein
MRRRTPKLALERVLAADDLSVGNAGRSDDDEIQRRARALLAAFNGPRTPVPLTVAVKLGGLLQRTALYMFKYLKNLIRCGFEASDDERAGSNQKGH